MTWPAALSVAALRVLRTAAGRRALRLGLLVGVLFALGFLCGEQAHAADGTPEVSSTGSVASSAVDGALSSAKSAVGEVAGASATAVTTTEHDTGSHPAKSGAGAATSDAGNTGVLAPGHGSSKATSSSSDSSERGSAARARSSVRRGSSVQTGGAAQASSLRTDPVVRPVVDSVVRSVGERVVRPVGDLVGAVADELAEARSSVLPTDPLPSLPTLPGSSTLPGLPGPPGEAELPVQVPPLQVTSVPGTQQPGAGTSPPSGGHAPDGRTVAHKAQGVAGGPRTTVVGTVPGTAVAAGAFGLLRDPRGGRMPARQAPASDAGALLGASALDPGTPRHADAHAVTLIDRPPLRPASGAAARPDAAGTRDRHRDIPVFPG